MGLQREAWRVHVPSTLQKSLEAVRKFLVARGVPAHLDDRRRARPHCQSPPASGGGSAEGGGSGAAGPSTVPPRAPKPSAPSARARAGGPSHPSPPPPPITSAPARKAKPSAPAPQAGAGGSSKQPPPAPSAPSSQAKATPAPARSTGTSAVRAPAGSGAPLTLLPTRAATVLDPRAGRGTKRAKSPTPDLEGGGGGSHTQVDEYARQYKARTREVGGAH
jgi:hypothetical protein